MYFFIDIFKGTSEAIHLFHLFSLVDASTIRSALLVLRLLARPFLGLFGEVAPHYIKSTRLLEMLASDLGFFFYKVHSLTP